MPELTATLRAFTEEAVVDLGGYVHDAEFDWAEIHVDAEAGEVFIPFAQEPCREFHLPAPQLVGRAPLGGKVYRVPFYRGRIVVRYARQLGIATDDRDHAGEIGGLGFDGARSTVRLYASIGPDVVVDVDAIDLSLEMTNQIAFERRRTARAFGHTDVAWRGEP